jgi:nitrate reductase gamma subunit
MALDFLPSLDPSYYLAVFFIGALNNSTIVAQTNGLGFRRTINTGITWDSLRPDFFSTSFLMQNNNIIV